ncbi:hypothetical protein [Lentibacillus saliphilus]|uniref:hypothetical protein n=1 Tax=Lentibacillus saliphilus TaxID=2737028 RepID=UPI001C2FEEEC|nr:hypothetical protein [Lentibacillus saliphilus]
MKTALQVITTMIYVTLLILLNVWLKTSGILANGDRTVYLVIGLIVLTITWLYITSFLQLKKQPHLLNHSLWKSLPILIGGFSFISVIGLAFIVSSDLISRWMGFFYVTIVYFLLSNSLFPLYYVSCLSRQLKKRKHHSLYIRLGSRNCPWRFFPYIKRKTSKSKRFQSSKVDD